MALLETWNVAQNTSVILNKRSVLAVFPAKNNFNFQFNTVLEISFAGWLFKQE